MDFSTGRDSCDNLIELLCITGHRFPHTNAKTGCPTSQQGFGVKKGDESQWMQCVWHMAGAEDYRHLSVLLVSECPAWAGPNTAHSFLSEDQLFHSKLPCVFCSCLEQYKTGICKSCQSVLLMWHHRQPSHSREGWGGARTMQHWSQEVKWGVAMVTAICWKSWTRFSAVST